MEKWIIRILCFLPFVSALLSALGESGKFNSTPGTWEIHSQYHSKVTIGCRQPI